MIVALSLKGIKKEEFQGFEKKVVWTFFMPPWSLEELKICREHIFSDMSEDLMLDIFYKSGGIPHKREVVLEQALKCIDDALKSVKNFDDLVRCFAEDVEFVKFSNRLVHRWPSLGYNKYYFKWASKHVFNKVQEKLKDQS
ncbi:hypothetical protein C1645_743347 [Glomus cerebriforme]|uniref:Uncharacterized protein n=1 Tax=Glomus cerebriforme TaxID=658196 RepID=A0A397SJS4_9GLOM|nr:hypothetical protein C1645_743347 [Glomus cerebriforme]